MYRLTLSDEIGILEKDIATLVELTGVKTHKTGIDKTEPFNIVSNVTNERNIAKYDMVC